MTREDEEIWRLLIGKYGLVMEVLYSYLTGRYWLNPAFGPYAGP